MANKHVLIVDDESPIREMLRFALEREGYDVTEANCAKTARLLLADLKPDIILMDWMMPGLSGIDFTRELKSEEVTAPIPIIMLTARGREDDQVHGLDAGADDYIVKPFSNRELMARIRAALRRSGSDDTETAITAGDLTLDPISCRVSVNEADIHLGPTEFRLLHFLIKHADRVYARGQLLDHVWGQSAYVEERTVDVHICRLRKALEPSSRDHYIQTVRGMGYRFSVKMP